MRLALAMSITFATACGRFDFSPIDAAPDAAIDPCDLERVDLGPFAAPTPVTAVNTAMTEDDPTPSDDGLELFYTSTQATTLGAADVYRVTRATPTSPWDATVRHVTELSTPQNENTPFLTSDNLTMYLVSNRPGTVGMDDIWIATRPDRQSSWSTPTNVAELNSTGLDRGPSLYHDGHALLMHSDRDGSQKFYVATRSALTDPWSTPVLLDGPTGIRGWMSNCGLELYFEVDPNAATSTDLFVARRDAEDQPFGTPQRLDSLSSDKFDQDIRLSPDRHHAYFASGRDGDSNIYEASR